MGEPVNKFSFFASFYEAAQDLDDELRLAFYDAMASYAFTGREPDFSGVMSTIWKLTKPNIDSSINGQKTGSKGGRPKKDNPPLKPPVETTSETDMDMDRDMEKDRDTEMDALEIDPSDQSISNASASGAAAAAEAAPPAAKGNTNPKCQMPGCDGWLMFDVKTGRFRCSKCRSTFAANEAVTAPRHDGERPGCPLCKGEVDVHEDGSCTCRTCGTHAKAPEWVACARTAEACCVSDPHSETGTHRIDGEDRRLNRG